MKTILRTLFGKSEAGRAARVMIIAAVLVYVMVITFSFQAMTGYAETLKENESAIEGSDSVKKEAPEKEESPYGEDISPGYDEEDGYKNTWNNDYNPEAYVVGEEENKRTATDKHFRMSDGSYTLMSYPTEIHYLSGGKYEEIDNTLEKKGSSYKNKSNILQVDIPETYSNGSKTYVSVGKYEISFKLEGYNSNNGKKAAVENKANKQTVSAKKNHEFTLKNQSGVKYAFDGTNVELEQILIGTQFKENIIVKAPLSSYVFSFDVKTKGLTLVLDESGDILAYSESGEVILSIPKGYMFDAAGAYSGEVEYTLVKIPSGYTLTVNADSDWINSKERVFPVTIDPTVTVSEAKKFKSAGRGLSFMDFYHVHEGGEFFLDFDIPSTLANSTVLWASLSVYIEEMMGNNTLLSVWANNVEFNKYEAPYVTYHSEVDPQNPDNMINVYSNCFDDPNNAYLPEQQLVIPKYIQQRFSINITRNIKQVVDFGMEKEFNGFAFSCKGQNVLVIADENCGSYQPYVEIMYRNTVGLEAYWDYDQYNISNNSVYINKYNDALTVVHEDVSVASNLPIDLQHVYMSAYKDKNYDVDGVFAGYSYGLGWKLNYQQIIRCRGNDFEYYDADGTMHYFYHDTVLTAKEGHRVAVDEDGLGLKLHTMPGSQYKMVDQNNNESWFDHHGRLYKIIDNNGNITNIIYGNGNQPTTPGLPLTEINDGQNRKITFTYSEGMLTAINYKRADGQTNAATTFTYHSSGTLKNITNDDETFTEYLYDENNLIRLTDESGLALKLVSDITLPRERGIDIPDTYTFIRWVKTRSIYRSTDASKDDSWLHISDNIYCDGLTLSVAALAGQSYVHYKTTKDYSLLAERYTKDESLIELFSSVFGDFIGEILLIAYANIMSLNEFKKSCADYYTKNFRIKNVYDNYGRLVTSYIDGDGSLTTVETRYESADGGLNVNNNKPKATATYTPGIVNYIKNGNFEKGTEGWSGVGNVGGTPYRSAYASGKFATGGNNSLEVFVSQPMSGFHRVVQIVTVPKGKYTLSANIRTDNLLVPYSATAPFGGYMALRSMENQYYAVSEYVNADIYSVNEGFKKVYITYEFNAPTTLYVDLMLGNASGFVYFDDVQLSSNDYGVINSGNFAVNEGFERWTSTFPDDDWLQWNANVEKITGANSFAGNNTLKLNGNINADTGIRQIVPITPSSQSRAFTVGAWINTFGRIYLPFTVSSIAMGFRALDANKNAIYGYMTGLDGNGYYDTPIRSQFALWHQISATFVVPANTRYIEITFTLKYTTSMLLVDNVSIVESQLINYSYNSKGQLSTYSDGQTEYTYSESGDGAAIKKDGENEYGIVKDSRGNVLSSTDVKRAVKAQYSYDSAGRVTSEIFSSLNSQKKISSQTSYQYISNNLIESVTDTDSLGFKTISNYYSYSGLLDKTTFNDGSYVEYIYSNGTQQGPGNFPAQVKTIRVNNKTSSGSLLSTCIYEYLTMSDQPDDAAAYGHRHVGMLKSVTMVNGGVNTVYSYMYDRWGNVIKVRLNGVDQILYAYRENDGALLSKTIANGYTEYYRYDTLGRMVEMRAAASPNANVWTVSDSSLKAHVYYEYSVSGTLLSVRDTIDDKGYWYQYDINGREILKGEGEYTSDTPSAAIQTKTVFETVYDRYGDVYNTNIIDLSGTKSNFGISVTPVNLSTGAYSRTNYRGTETVSINGVEKIKFSHNNFGTVTREDNVLLGKSIIYTRSSNGKVISMLIGNYTTGTVTGTSYTPFYTFKSERYDYDATVNGFSTEWVLANNTHNATYPVTTLPDQNFEGTVITNIIRLHQQSLYSAPYGGCYSLVDPTLLMNSGQIALDYWMRMEKAGEYMRRMCFLYSDGTIDYGVDNNGVRIYTSDLEINLLWQHYSCRSTPGKTVARLMIGYNFGTWINIGNIQVSVLPNAWDVDWLLANQHTREEYINSVPPPARVPNEVSNGIEVSNIVKIHHANFFTNASGCHTLVNPDLLRQGGDCIKLTYMVRRINPKDENLIVYGLRFKYTDGSASDAAVIAKNTAWQTFSLTSAVGKTVAGIELLWNYDEYLHLGNVFLSMQSAGRLDGRIAGETLFNGNYIKYNYDELGRASSTAITANKSSTTEYLKETYTYVDGTGGNVLNIQNRTETTSGITISSLNGVVSVTGTATSEISVYIYFANPVTAGRYYLTMSNTKGFTSSQMSYFRLRNSNGAYSSTFYTMPNTNFTTVMDITGEYTQASFRFTTGTATNFTMTPTLVCMDNTSYTVSGLNITRGATNIVSYNYVYNMDNAALGADKLKRANPYNIYQIKEGSIVKAEYYYDGLGRLIRENDGYNNKTVIYTYDGNNNITSKTSYAYAAGNGTLTDPTVKGYTYDQGTFKDRLIGYNGGVITYDTLGNPLSYLGKTLTWSGRELASFSNGGLPYTYKYDAGGIRLSKSIETIATNYLYDGGRLIRETNGTDTIWYVYDQNGMSGFQLNGSNYYYIRNLQGDVTKVMGAESGNTFATYTYDAWGNCTIGTNVNNIATKNPIRYRGYYYDNESGFYYLNSRYYDPETGRFISPDILVENGSLYAYCGNDPINNYDPNGYFFISITIGLSILATKILVGVAVVAGLTAMAYIESQTHFIENGLNNIVNTLESLWDNNKTMPDINAPPKFDVLNTPSLPGISIGIIPNYFPTTEAGILGNTVFAKSKGVPGRPEIKKKGKEGLEKKKTKDNWKNKNGKRPEIINPRSHNPNPEHRNPNINPKHKTNIIIWIDIFDE